MKPLTSEHHLHRGPWLHRLVIHTFWVSMFFVVCAKSLPMIWGCTPILRHTHPSSLGLSLFFSPTHTLQTKGHSCYLPQESHSTANPRKEGLSFLPLPLSPGPRSSEAEAVVVIAKGQKVHSKEENDSMHPKC